MTRDNPINPHNLHRPDFDLPRKKDPYSFWAKVAGWIFVAFLAVLAAMTYPEMPSR